MAENIELIAAKDLPITEAEQVSVVCIDNGELKQKPGASFGGGYITVVNSIGEDDTGSMQATVNESYDNFIDILLAGGNVWLDFDIMTGTTFDTRTYMLPTAWTWVEGTLQFLVILVGGTITVLCPNGTWTPEG